MLGGILAGAVFKKVWAVVSGEEVREATRRSTALRRCWLPLRFMRDGSDLAECHTSLAAGDPLARSGAEGPCTAELCECAGLCGDVRVRSICQGIAQMFRSMRGAKDARRNESRRG